MLTEFKKNIAWIRDKGNPVLSPGKDGQKFSRSICMNPCVLRRNDLYYLFYAGDDASGRRQIRLATAPVDNPTQMQAHGPLFENGPSGSFDAAWCVLPNIVQMDTNLWHMYYTGNCNAERVLSSFPGIGLAVSRDLLHWRKYADRALIDPGEMNCVGIAGGSLVKRSKPGGGMQLMYYYTACPTVGDNTFLDQQKYICYSLSDDGIHWKQHVPILLRTPANDYENIAAAGPVVKVERGLYRMWYSAIGTRYGFYSICYAESDDGVHWFRGDKYGENLQLSPALPPADSAVGTWDSQMVEYPTVIDEGNRLRLFYTGNGYGLGGIGTAVSAALRAAAVGKPAGAVKIWGHTVEKSCLINCMDSIRCADLGAGIIEEGYFWSGLADGNIWMEMEPYAHQKENALTCRVLVMHHLDELELHMTLHNRGKIPLHRIIVIMRFLQGDLALSPEWQDCAFGRDGSDMTLTLDCLEAGKTVNLIGHLRHEQRYDKDKRR